MQYKILLGCPISSPREWILPTYLEHIKNIQFNKQQIVLCFLANNIQGNELSILKKFQNENINQYNNIIIEKYTSPKIFIDDRSTCVRQTYGYQWLAYLRNILLKKTINLDCTHFFSVDSDILVKPDILNRLLNDSQPIISSLIYNGYLHTPKNVSKDYNTIENAYKYPNIMRETTSRKYEHITNYRVKYPEKNPIGTLIEVQYTGACILMTKEVCENTQYDNISFVDKNINNAKYFSYGEDEPWSFSARKAGFKLYCDISMYSQHVMSPELLEQFKDF